MQNKDKTVIDPIHFIQYLKEARNLKQENVPSTVIFVFLDYIIPLCKKHFSLKKIEGFDAGELYNIGKQKNKLGIFCCSGIGSPVAVINMEELIAYGVKNFIVVGTAGSLQHNLNIGDIVICNKAIIDEGTSQHYINDQISIKPKDLLLDKFFEYLYNCNIKIKKGSTWTTDAPYRETQKKVIDYQKQGVLTVEMEMSALFTLAKYRNVNIVGSFVISDSLANLQWNPALFSETVEQSLLSLVKHSINFSRQLKDGLS